MTAYTLIEQLANPKSTFPFYPMIFLKVCVHFSHTGCGFPLVFSVCSLIYCHIMFIPSLWQSGSNVGLKKQLSCALERCLFIGCAVWFIKKIRKLQQGHVFLSAQQRHLTALHPPSPGAKRKRLETRDGSSWEASTSLLMSVVCRHPEPMGKEAVPVTKNETLALQKIIIFDSERNCPGEDFFLTVCWWACRKGW